ncbi:LLM class flavin-dependent oxidoreductase [Saccharothrix sp. ST-888]|uniref:LLM class flavin-dependent oxidoreductase n=1 Tax=Saccharothrix sp. ST-888 TaxID=1427391 RepID=UPI0005ED26F6|nr:LLM class flavin-dependent oxidoreductase [Saccharothrix sp. ST-888]
MTLRLSILDQSPVPADGTPADALRASLDVARAADGLGYHRYWVAEHHNSPSFAGTSPEILVTALLGETRRLRIGSGGVLLPRYDPYKVAEVFRVLAALHPGRVDLGIGRAGGPAQNFPQKVVELARLLAEPYEGYVPPELWLLGAGSGSAELAAALGTRFAFAHFLRPTLGRAALTAYRTGDRLPSDDAAPPRGALAVRVVTAETEAKAAELARSFLFWRSRKDLGDDRPFPSLAEVRAHRWTALEEERAADNSLALVSGTPEQVHAELSRLAAAHGVDELVVNTLTHDPADRIDSYRLLAETFRIASGTRELTGVA